MKVKSRCLFNNSSQVNTEISQKLREVHHGCYQPLLLLEPSSSIATVYPVSHVKVTRRHLLPHCHVVVVVLML